MKKGRLLRSLKYPAMNFFQNLTDYMWDAKGNLELTSTQRIYWEWLKRLWKTEATNINKEKSEYKTQNVVLFLNF